MGEDTLNKLVNPPFQFGWNGDTYEIKKANLSQVVQFQGRLQQYIESKEIGADQKLAAFCIWLLLKDKISGLTEEQVLEQTPGNINPQEILLTLGFLRAAKETAIPGELSKTTGDSSSS